MAELVEEANREISVMTLDLASNCRGRYPEHCLPDRQRRAGALPDIGNLVSGQCRVAIMTQMGHAAMQFLQVMETTGAHRVLISPLSASSS